jgi:peptidoglycan-associated lipoprotein
MVRFFQQSSRWFSLLFGICLLASGCSGPTYPACESDSDCEDKGEFCVEKTCQACRTDGDCKEGERCRGGICEEKPECDVDADCKGNNVCRSGKCLIECQGDKDCGTGLKCSENRCMDKFACSATSDCDPGSTCMAGRCLSPDEASRGMCSFPSVQFSFNEAGLTSSVKDALAQVADCVRRQPGTLVLEGHCDERGTEEYNLALGDRRARSVKDYLVRMGVESSKLSVVSKGELEPVDSASTEAAWAANRRVEFNLR